MEKISELTYQLNQICKDLHKTYKLNYGGCCYAAYCIASLLEQYDITFSLIVFDERYNLSNFDNLFDLPESMDHYAIIIETDETIKCINCSDSDFYKQHQIFKISSNQILEYYENNCWNDTYDSGKNTIVKNTIEHLYYDII
jgi:hypothetical protein